MLRVFKITFRNHMDLPSSSDIEVDTLSIGTGRPSCSGSVLLFKWPLLSKILCMIVILKVLGLEKTI
jgi:hypothetical protein